MDELEHMWPPFQLRIIWGEIELRVARERDLVGLARAADDIYEGTETPFTRAWSDEPTPVREKSALRHHWSALANIQPEKWDIHLVVVFQGKPIGVQSIHSTDFPQIRTVRTGSWITRSMQGKGIGTRVRRMILQLCFESLNARRAETSAYLDNKPSQSVTEKLGYERNGIEEMSPYGKPREAQRYLLKAENWLQHRSDEIVIAGVTPELLEMLGATVD